jgi:predicted metal-dependent phosphotriesterase family hydrolase
MHEHVFILDSEVNHNYPERSWEGPKQARITEAAETLRGIVARGIDAIVDLTVLGLGRSMRELMDRGSTIGMDRFGPYGNRFPTFDERVDTVARLCELGYGDRMVLSHETMCHSDRYASVQAQFPDWVFTHLSDDVLPALRERGVEGPQIDQMVVANPRRLFEQHGAY